MTRARVLIWLALLCFLSGTALWLSEQGEDENRELVYREQFEQKFDRHSRPRDMEIFVSQTYYDERFLSWRPPAMSNRDGDLAWGLSYRMMGLNEMFRYSGDEKYLQANLELAQTVCAARDRELGEGASPCWSSAKYDGVPRVYLVHTAMITFPLVEMLALKDGEFNQAEADLLKFIEESIAYHDPQWRDGPGKGEGHYVHRPDQKPELRGQVLPINRQCAMARALWMLGKVTGKVEYRERSLALARFFKNRLTKNEDESYTWPYLLNSISELTDLTEDSSHAALTISVVPILHQEGLVFDDRDLVRFASTVAHRVLGEPSGLIYGEIGGHGDLPPDYVALPARWLRMSTYNRSIYPRIFDFYRNFELDPNPHRQSLAVALLLRYGKDFSNTRSQLNKSL